KYVREFFCLDEPPGPHDSLEESRALCESLEDAVYHLRHEVAKKDKLIGRLTEEVVALREENEQLLKSLRSENSSSSFRQSSPPPESESSLAECEYPSAVEADQSHTNEDSDKSSILKSDVSSRMLEEITVVTLKKTFRVRFSDIVNEVECISSLE
ncbi:uncharacterized protein LOC102804387, partial [Saccoglossus kowalevskii]|uniref:Sorting nexin-16-like n=1 Tax=Saccoglossus kowalevskii TaxID=10224 RepID=A0ABM0LV15_SACKO